MAEQDRQSRVNTDRKYNPPVSLSPLDFETAVEGLLAVDPKKPDDDGKKPQRKKKPRDKK